MFVCLQLQFQQWPWRSCFVPGHRQVQVKSSSSAWRKGKSGSAPSNIMTLVTSHVVVTFSICDRSKVFPRLWVDSPCTMCFSSSIWFLSVESGAKKTSPASLSLYALQTSLENQLLHRDSGGGDPILSVHWWCTPVNGGESLDMSGYKDCNGVQWPILWRWIASWSLHLPQEATFQPKHSLHQCGGRAEP